MGKRRIALYIGLIFMFIGALILYLFYKRLLSNLFFFSGFFANLIGFIMIVVGGVIIGLYLRNVFESATGIRISRY